MYTEVSNEALEARARRAAKKIGLVAMKCRKGVGTSDNLGSFTILNPYTNGVVAGVRCDLSAEDVIAFCRRA